MRKPANDKERVSGRHFSWLLGKRNGTYYADGRGNHPPLGRFSLGTTNRVEALQTLSELDRRQAVKSGKADPKILEQPADTLSMTEGRKLYEDYVSRPAVTSGTRPATRKRYRAVLDKFLAFAESIELRSWTQVTTSVLRQYATHLENLGYEYNTQYLELTTLKQVNKWLIEEGHLPPGCRIKLKLPRDKETTTYCWKLAEFQAMVEFCRGQAKLIWLADILLTLGMTGMRISELAQLRWSNLVFDDHPKIILVDGSRQSRKRRREAAQTLKGKRGRSFPMKAELIPLLQALPRQADQLVFHGPHGGKIKPDTIRNVLVREVLTPLKQRFLTLEGETGFEHGRLHSFRHFFCSQCANSGVPERMLMTWLGHADAAMVRRYYHADASESQRQMDRVSIPVVNGGIDAADVQEQETSPPSKTNSP